MAKFTSYNARIQPPNGWYVQWKIEDNDAVFTVLIERSSSPEGPWSTVKSVPSSTFAVSDLDPPSGSYWDLSYYRLTLMNGAIVEAITPGFTMDGEPSPLTTEVIRQHNLLLYGVNGHGGRMSRKFACYKRTLGGTSCPYCINDVGLRIKDNCSQCQNTGVLEGWSDPVLFSGRFIDPQQKNVQRSISEQERDLRTLFTSNVPILGIGDVLVQETMGYRFVVNDVRASTPNDVVTSQTASIERLRYEHEEARLVYPSD